MRCKSSTAPGARKPLGHGQTEASDATQTKQRVDEDLGAVGAVGVPSAVGVAFDRKPWWTLVWWRSQSSAEFSSEVAVVGMPFEDMVDVAPEGGCTAAGESQSPSEISAAMRMWVG